MTDHPARARLDDLPPGLAAALNRVWAVLPEARLVGGAVRDLMLGLEPKDFDLATSATPEEVRATFRRSRIIGRRFRLVHVMIGAETIEVSTFRGPSGAADESADAAQSVTDEHGRILRDNVFGTVEEDARRRELVPPNGFRLTMISRERANVRTSSSSSVPMPRCMPGFSHSGA